MDNVNTKTKLGMFLLVIGVIAGFAGITDCLWGTLSFWGIKPDRNGDESSSSVQGNTVRIKEKAENKRAIW